MIGYFLVVRLFLKIVEFSSLVVVRWEFDFSGSLVAKISLILSGLEF